MTHHWNTAEAYDPNDYLHFYATALSADRADADVDLIWSVAGLQPGNRVLDLACGHGRIANRLAAHGAVVTGADVSEPFLAIGHRAAVEAGVRVGYVRADMRAIPCRPFDIIVSWFSAFGYHDDDTDRAVLRQVWGALVPGGRFVLELNNRDAVLMRFVPVDLIERDGDIMIRRRRFDALTGRMHNDTTVVRHGTVRQFTFFTRLFSLPEIRDWLRQAGFVDIEAFGPDGRPLGMEPGRMIVRASRPSSALSSGERT